MGLLANLFSPKTIAETAKSAVAGLDSIIYTDQEKAEKTQIAQKLYAKLWMSATPSALSRRIISSVIVAVWAFLIILMALIFKFDEDWANFVFKILDTVVLQPMNILVGFYFLKQVVGEYRDNK